MKNTENTIPMEYNPANDNEYMSAQMINFFHDKLLDLRHRFLSKEHEAEMAIHHSADVNAEMVDGAQEQTRLETEILPTIEFERNFLIKIENAFERMQNGQYGYCEKTGQPIGLERMQAVPTAIMCIEAQEEEEILHGRENR